MFSIRSIALFSSFRFIHNFSTNQLCRPISFVKEKNTYLFHHPMFIWKKYSFFLINVFQCHQTLIIRSFAKGKDKKKERKSEIPRVILYEQDMEKVLKYETLKSEIEALIDDFKTDLKLNFNLKLNLRSIESLKISYDGTKVTLGDIVNIVRKQNDIIINLSATPNAVKPTMNAIIESGLNLNPQHDRGVIYLKIPKVTTEHRQVLIKSIQLAGQKLKEQIKNRHFHKKFYSKDLKKLSQDLVNDVQENLNYYIKQKCSEIDDIVKQKEDSLTNN